MLGGDNRDPRPVERRDGVFAEKPLVAFVVGVGDHRDAGAEQLRTGGGDLELSAALDPETQIVEQTLPRTVLDLGLGDRGLEVDVPHGRRLDVVDLALGHEVEKAPLRDAPAVVVDRGVLLRPVDRQPEVAPQVLESLFVLGRDDAAGLDEVAPGDLLDLLAFPALRVGLPIGIVGEVGVAANTQEVLDPALGG